jgi:hypothetical protein
VQGILTIDLYSLLSCQRFTDSEFQPLKNKVDPGSLAISCNITAPSVVLTSLIALR